MKQHSQNLHAWCAEVKWVQRLKWSCTFMTTRCSHVGAQHFACYDSASLEGPSSGWRLWLIGWKDANEEDEECIINSEVLTTKKHQVFVFMGNVLYTQGNKWRWYVGLLDPSVSAVQLWYYDSRAGLWLTARGLHFSSGNCLTAKHLMFHQLWTLVS